MSRMPRVMTLCPSGLGPVPTGYRTGDLDLSMRSHRRSFRCACGEIHSWCEDMAWVEAPTQAPGGDARAP